MALYRVKHDNELPWILRIRRSFGWIKGGKLRGLPETRRYEGGRGNFEPSVAALAFIRSINTPKAFVYLFKQKSGWCNHGKNLEYLTFAGSYVNVTRQEGNRCYIETLSNAGPFPPAGFFQFPPVQWFGVVYNDGHWARGTDTPVGMAYTALIVRPEDVGKVWIDIKYLVKL
jgi:hypothetical protein